MFNEFLTKNINNGTYAAYIPAAVQVGYSQVEPNHLSAQRTSQVYAQLPAAENIPILQQGQFVKYDYANEEVNFGNNANGFETGEWMLVYNEIKLYREFQNDCEFAMIKDNYNARVYSPFGGTKYGNNPDVVDFTGQGSKQTRYYGGTFANGAVVGGQASISGKNIVFGEEFKYERTEDVALDTNKTYYTLNTENTKYEAVSNPDVAQITTYYERFDNPDARKYALDTVTTENDYYEPHYNADPFHIAELYAEKMMKEGTKMVPRVFKTNIGDIFTTNAIDTNIEDLAIGDLLYVRKTDKDETHKTAGFLAKNDENDDTLDKKGIAWQVVKIYTMPDHQFGVKIMRIA